MTQEIFVIGDTHFGHTNILTFKDSYGNIVRKFNSIEEHDQTIIDNWNKVVKPKDKVYHLGDVSLNKQSVKLIEQCNGTKVLIRGNHDLHPTKYYLQYFRDVYGVRGLGDPKCILTHVPIHPSSVERWLFNVHGHLHHNIIDDPRYINVSCEQVNFTPINLREVLMNRLDDNIDKLMKGLHEK